MLTGSYNESAVTVMKYRIKHIPKTMVLKCNITTLFQSHRQTSEMTKQARSIYTEL